MTLNTQQIKQLKAAAHTLQPVVRIGQHGVSAGVLRELDIALDHHELIKVKVAGERSSRHKMIDELCAHTKAQCIQRIGGIAVLYRQRKTEPGSRLSD